MPRSAASRNSSRRTHTLGGCSTCRRRHMKCDLLRPACLNCQAISAVCGGYNSNLVWMNASDTTTVPDTIRHVRPREGQGQGRTTRSYLFTEESRVLMTSTLQSDLASKSVDRSISELDSRSKEKSSATGDHISVGPFGILSLPAMKPAPVTPHPDTSTSIDDLVPFSDDFANLNPPSVESFESPNEFNGWLDWPDLFDLDQDFPTLELTNIEASSGFAQSSTDGQLDSSSGVRQHHTEASPRDDSRAISWPEILKSTDAGMLLNHFKCHVIPQLVSIPLGNKSIWDVTVVNSAILTLAKVTYMTSEHVSKAELANTLAICATSAIHLAAQHEREGKDDGPHWTEVATQCIYEARQSLRLSLQHETKGTKTAKYKDQLNATFAVINHSILYNHQPEARADMLESERLLRFRGLAKPYISRKARLLHHLYSWIRIVNESTYVLHDYKNGRPDTITGIARNMRKRKRREGDGRAPRHPERSDDANPRLDDFLRDQLNTADAEQPTDSRQDDEASTHDIHYENSTDRKGTLYMQLYGISENWLSLVSQITRLANVLDSFKVSQNRDIETFEFLERRKARLEEIMCSFAISDGNAGNTSLTNEIQMSERASLYAELRSQMIRAFNSSLMIFFYRRVRDVSPWILQEHVGKVIHALQDFKSTCESHQLSGPGSPWPSFIAGCEAMSTTQRGYFKTWFESAFNLTGFKRFEVAKTCMVEVWEHRDSSTRDRGRGRDLVYSWVSLLQEKRAHVMLA